MTRKLTFLILALFALISGHGAKAWGADVTYSFTPDNATSGNSSTAYVTSPYSFTYNGIGWSFNQWNPSTLQIKTNQSSATSEFNFKNTSAFSGRIKSVVITFSALTVSDASKLCFIGGSNAISSLSGGSAGTWNSTAKTLTWIPTATDNFTYFAFYQNGKAASGNNYLATANAIVITYEDSDTPSKTLESLAISGTPTKTEYETGEEFDPAGLVVTGTYDDESTADLTNAADWTFDPATFTSTSQTSVSVTATVDGKTATETYNVTVTAALPKITITADKIANFASSYAEYTWTANDVSGKCWAYRGGSSGSYNIQFNKTTYVYNTTAVPGRITSVKMTKVAGTTRSWSIYGADEALTGDNYTTAGTQIGSAQEVSSETGTTWNVPNDKNYTYFYITKADGGTNIGEIVITYEPAKTPTTIAIKTAPNQTEYYAGETFNPAGLVITATYDDESTEDIAYADHANDFTFEPSTSDALTTEDFQVTITYGGKTVNQTITVAEAPKYGVSYYSLGILLTEEQVSRGETCNAPSVTTPEGWDFVGWTENGEYLYNTTAPEPFNTLAPIEATHSLHAVFSKLVGNFENKKASVSIENYALANNWVNGEKYLTVIVDENISVNATAKGTTGQYNSAAQDWRMYQTSQNYSQWKINATNNSTLNSVIFTYNNDSNGIISYGGNTYASDSEIALSGNESSTFTVGNTGTANNGQVRITNISIAYTIGSGTRYYAINRVIDAETTISEPTTWEGKTEVYGTITVNSILTADEIINTTASNLIIEDGAQLIHHNGNVAATFHKNITGYETEGFNVEADRTGYYLIANPTDNSTVTNLKTSKFDLYTFDPTANFEWNNLEAEGESQDITRGTGYLYASSTDTDLEFAGELLPAGSTELSLISATEGGEDFPGFNLVGNPYACNAYVSQAAYRLNAEGSEFESIQAGSAIAPCEGFFVEAPATDEPVTLSTTDPSNTSRSLNLTVNQNRSNVIDRAIVSFDGSNNLHKFMLNPAHTNISLAKNGEEFAAVSTSSKSGEMPVNFKAEKNGTYTITVNTENVDAEYLHLIDNMTGTDVDLLASTGSASYTFEAKTSDYASRFKLVFGVNNADSTGSTSNFAYMSDGNLVIDNIEGQATLQIIDELGRVISTETVNGSYNKTLNLKAGLYILNLNGMTQKIVVK